MAYDKPKPFIEVTVRNLSDTAPHVACCAGFERNSWRVEALAEHLIEWLPEFALNAEEYSNITGANARRALRNAAKNIYTSTNYEKRGEIGEILLHAIIRQEFNTEPLISKIYFKDSPNDTVKGFDSVHIVQTDKSVQLWLGEAKIYTSFNAAVYEINKSLKSHLVSDYLRLEFAAIVNKLEKTSPYFDIAKKLLDQNTSLDKIFECITIPVFVSYNSNAVKLSTASDKNYLDRLKNEILEKVTSLRTIKTDAATIKLIFILFPMNTKSLLTTAFDKKLKGLAA